MIILLILLFVISVTGYIILRRLGGGNFPWIHFYSKGKEAGFSFKEINLLRRVAVENRLENPTALFWSIKQLDRSIRGTIIKFRNEGKEDVEPYLSFIGKLFEFRKRVELNLPKYTLGLNNTRKIVQHQRIKITLPGQPQAMFTASVVENLKRYIAISYPEGPKMQDGFSWAGQIINIYFWRVDDAGYIFNSKVLEDYSSKQYPILHIAHSESLTRTQKRRSIRIEISIPAYIYALRNLDQSKGEIEKTPGIKCRLVDISEDGAAVLVGGKAKVGIPLKLQFRLEIGTIVTIGTVKGVSFDTKKNQSILHIQSSIPSQSMKNQLLSYIYNIFGERDDKTRISKSVSSNTAS